MNARVSWFPVLAVSLLLLIPTLSLCPVFQVSEGREGVVVQEMLRTGNYILPLRHGEIVPSKPILFHWVVAGMANIWGELNSFILRLPSALAATSICVLVFLIGRGSKDLIMAYSSSAVLLSSYGFVRMSGDGRVDMFFAAFVVAALVVWIRAASNIVELKLPPSSITNRTYFLFGLFLGLAVLAKGPLGIVLPLLIVSAIAISEWGMRGALSLFRPVLIVAPILASPWYLFAVMQGKREFIQRQIFFENIYRFIGGAGVNTKPIWFYFGHFWTQAAPWSIVFIVCLFLIKIPKDDSPRAFSMRAALCWFLVTFVFLTLSSGKRRAYLLPLLPALAIYLGGCFSIVFEQGGWKRTLFSPMFKKILLGLWFLSALIPILIALQGVFSPFIFENCADCQATLDATSIFVGRHYFLFVVGFVSLTALSFYFINRGSSQQNLPLLAIGIFVLCECYIVCIGQSLLAIKGYAHSHQNFAQNTSQILGADHSLTAIKDMRNEVFDSFFYYYNRSVPIVPESTRPPLIEGYYIATREWFDSLAGSEKAMLQVELEGGSKTDTKGEHFVILKPNPTHWIGLAIGSDEMSCPNAE